ncbi:chlamydia polymorphic membrane middle domain protein, partial [Chlamydia psittaci 02DC22]
IDVQPSSLIAYGVLLLICVHFKSLLKLAPKVKTSTKAYGFQGFPTSFIETL